MKNEEKIVRRVINKLKLHDWYTVILHGNIHTNGMPDIFACHFNYGIRLIEIKDPNSYSFTGAQLEKFPKLCANGAGVWILTSDSQEEYNKLFKPPNWVYYLSIWNKR